ncbi:MAG: universal stress protein [Solirubrobacterales bacterium]
MYRNVVVAYDGGEGARAALAKAVEIAARDGAALTIVEATSEQMPSVVPGSPRQSPPERAERARKELREAVEALDPSLEASPWVVGGPAAKAILTVAEDIEADLIVTGSRNRGAVARAVLGSVSTDILHGARCDVLVTQPG